MDVYLDIASRGYTVIPQFESIGYYIDLVIVGGARKLAVECDGDLWHGRNVLKRTCAGRDNWNVAVGSFPGGAAATTGILLLHWLPYEEMIRGLRGKSPACRGDN